MKFTLERSDALAAINRVVGIVSRNTNVQVLNNILIETDGGSVRIRATDLDMEAVTTAPAAISEPGRTTVNAAKFREIANSASPGSQISYTLTTDDDPRLVVKSGRSVFKLPVLDADIFPSIPDDTWSSTFEIEAAILSDMLTRTVFAAGTEMSMPALLGVYLTISDDDLLAVGCSGRRFATVRTSIPDGAADMPSVIIPTKSVAQIVRLLGEIGTASISVSTNKWRVEANGTTITGKVIDYPYLEYQRGLPTEIPHVARAGRDALIGCVRRALIAGESDSVGVGVRLAFTAGLLTVTGKNTDEEARDEIEIDYDGPDVVVGLTATYILDAAANLAGDVVNIGLTDKVVVFASPSDESAVNSCAKRIVK
jgi:DNA polymerase-3 subunit beta